MPIARFIHLSTSPSSTVFPTYLFPALPFRRRRSSASTTLSSSPASPSSPPSFPSSTSYLRCSRCLSDLCHTSQIVSKGFNGRHGRAYLVAPPSPSQSDTATATATATGSLPNTHTHKAVPRQLVTGAHTVADISCAQCGVVLGWKYVGAEDESQRYKVGKFILETRRIVKGVCWAEAADGEDEREAPALDVEMVGQKMRRRRRGDAGEKDGELEFDSQDEDECDDLFAGVWSPTLAGKRRKNRVFDYRDYEEDGM